MQRREFLKLAGSFIVTASCPGLITACARHDIDEAHTFGFSHGVASGDPRPTSAVIWTRVEPLDGHADTIPVTAEVSLSEDFTNLVLQQDLEVSKESDYTLRVLVENLSSDTIYFYRFITVNQTVSITGRTRTAPALTDTKNVNFAFVSCQERKHGFYSAYRQMLNDDIDAPEQEQIHFVLHLGDFIYETRNDPLQEPVDENHDTLPGGLTDANGLSRDISPFPDGATTKQGVEYANTVDDYRHLYKEYLKDPDLQAARARWPFIIIWDDHEFSDDCWQTEANYNDQGEFSTTDEPSEQRKVAANQAWFEYTPVNLTFLEGMDSDLQRTKEFKFAKVENTPNTEINQDNMVSNSDNIAAINTITWYRSFRFGTLVDLVLTDNRSYRSDHAVPEDISGNYPVFIHPRVGLPLDLVNQMDAGKAANNGNPSTFFYIGNIVLNSRRNSPPGTILGKAQKQWWKDTMQRSTAQWKLWANSVPLLRYLINLSALGGTNQDIILSADSWDGYHTERNELMSYLQDNGITNVISLSGDIHAHSAGTVMDDYDSNTPTPVIAEVVCCAISSTAQYTAVEKLSRFDNPTALEATVRTLITYDSPANDGTAVNNLNNTLLNGVASGLAAVNSNSIPDITAAKDPIVNSHRLRID